MAMGNPSRVPGQLGWHGHFARVLASTGETPVPPNRCPGGTFENSPAVHCWEVKRRNMISPVGTIEDAVGGLLSIVPTGRTALCCHLPSDKSLGYFQMPRRGKEEMIDDHLGRTMRPGARAHKRLD